jgi:quinol monooxygenase YgiN
MSVLMTLRVKGDPAKLEELAASRPEVLREISARGQEYGVEYHRFYANGDEIMVVDLWPDAESFQRFFAASPEIPEFMQQVGVTSEPEITFYRQLETGDDIG